MEELLNTFYEKYSGSVEDQITFRTDIDTLIDRVLDSAIEALPLGFNDRRIPGQFATPEYQDGFNSARDFSKLAIEELKNT